MRLDLGRGRRGRPKEIPGSRQRAGVCVTVIARAWRLGKHAPPTGPVGCSRAGSGGPRNDAQVDDVMRATLIGRATIGRSASLTVAGAGLLLAVLLCLLIWPDISVGTDKWLDLFRINLDRIIYRNPVRLYCKVAICQNIFLYKNKCNPYNTTACQHR